LLGSLAMRVSCTVFHAHPLVHDTLLGMRTHDRPIRIHHRLLGAQRVHDILLMAVVNDSDEIECHVRNSRGALIQLDPRCMMRCVRLTGVRWLPCMQLTACIINSHRRATWSGPPAVRYDDAQCSRRSLRAIINPHLSSARAGVRLVSDRLLIARQ